MRYSCVGPHGVPYLRMVISSVRALINVALTAQVRFVTDTKERLRILESCHSGVTSGHMGTKRTLARMHKLGEVITDSQDVTIAMSSRSEWADKVNAKMMPR